MSFCTSFVIVAVSVPFDCPAYLRIGYSVIVADGYRRGNFMNIRDIA